MRAVKTNAKMPAAKTNANEMRAACLPRRATLAVVIAIAVAYMLLCGACGKRRAGAFAYVSNERGGTVTVIDTKTDKVVSTISVGARPRGIRISPDAKLIYVALSYPSNKREGEDKIAAIDVASEKIVAKIDVGSDPERFAVSRDGKRIYVSNEDAGTASVIDVDAKKIIATLVVGIEPEGVTLSPDGRWCYVTAESSGNVSVIDTQTNQVAATFSVGARPRETAFSPDGARAYVTAENGRNVSVVDVAGGHRVVSTIELAHAAAGDVKPVGILVSRDGRTLYVAAGRANCVFVIDVQTQKVVATIPTGQRTWGLAFTPDERKLYAANGLSNDVTVIDTATNSVITTIPAGDGAWGVAVKP